jgi:metal-sulfur cluster biosynthetic enzyme
MTTITSLAISEAMVYTALKEVIDPELGINIVDLGLIYSIDIDPATHVSITMTLTTPGCPLHASFAQEIERVLWQSIAELSGVSVELIWDPPWNPFMISTEGRSRLGI